MAAVNGKVKVYIGSEEHVRYVSKKAFAKLGLGISLAHVRTYRLPDWKLEVFEHLQYWLDNGRMQAFGGTIYTDDSDKARLFEYLELYQNAQSWGAEIVQNAIMDVIIGRETCYLGYFSIPLVQKIYTMTTEGSHLRRFVVDSFIYKAAGWKTADLLRSRWSLEKHLDRGNKTFVLDCSVASLHGRDLARTRYPNQGDCCRYHDHQKTVKCDERGSKRRKRVDSSPENESSNGSVV